MNNRLIYHKGEQFNIKHNLFKCPIIKIGYITDYINRKVTCIIDWYNPIYSKVCTTRASAKCKVEDKYDIEFGKKLSESRCKHSVYNRYQMDIIKIYPKLCAKNARLINKELNHQTELINNL